MIALTSKQRRELRSQAQTLHPVVSVGQQGLTPRVMHEIDVALRAHGLIKVRVFSEDRDQRDTMLAQIAAELDAAAVQHLGKVLILWRPRAEEPVKAASRPARKPVKARGAEGARRPSNARESRVPTPAARRARGSASPEDTRTAAGSPRGRSAWATKSDPRSGDDAQSPALRRRRAAAGSAGNMPGKRPPRASAFGAADDKPAFGARRGGSASRETGRTPTGKSAPSPRRRRRAG